ncbi:protein-L-isoaspartate O-methyltransferase family protein [Enterovirga rhinocerotis]|uniref:Protein-L-isoaspartate O-methyltransferase n=1 Tax=Enterovirga rhinocerotis TaxID=1339210 RepID=A0A4R7CA25_9HYPH|nr:protein-L-isoaspartate O-methyltransferase [Enterovirga rhinocerotis]TDR93816.1 protein-L-isoaspartate(D-aspartate) O-methyltransferase [Enterovirga rhinocerotis]
MSSFDTARRTMVDCQLRTFDVSDRAVLAAMAEVPRERFVPPGREALAYLDRNVPLSGHGPDARVMLAPMLLARLIQALAVQDGDRVLDVGGGFGYPSAVLSAMGGKVTLLESEGDLAEGALKHTSDWGVTVRSGPLEAGSKEDAPFDCILINGAVEERPAALLDQLAEGGRLACFSTEENAGRALLYVRSAGGFGFRPLFDAVVPPLAAFRKAPSFTF